MRLRPLGFLLTVAAASLVVSCGATQHEAIVPAAATNAWARFLMPWGNWGTAGSWTVAVENGDRIVARGTDVELLATAEKFGVAEPPMSLTLEWRDSAGTTDRRAMPFDFQSGLATVL